jgi:hypothetical protein
LASFGPSDGPFFSFENKELDCPQKAKHLNRLCATVGLLEKVYATGRKYAADFKATMNILFDDHLPKWNYRALPETG